MLVPVRKNREGLLPSSIIDRFFEEPIFKVFDDFPMSERGWNPAVEVSETKNELTFSVELPGLEQKDVSINVERNVLSFSGERKTERTEGREYIRCERWYGKFYRSFQLPDTADTEKITAKLASGILTIVVPKKEEAKPKQITVSVA